MKILMFLDDKKEAVVTIPLSEKKLLTTENVTISDEQHKHTEKIAKNEEVIKGTDEIHKIITKITTNKEVGKGTEKLEDMKESVVTIRRKYSYNFQGQSKGYTVWFNLDHEFLGRRLSTLEPDFY